MDKFDMIQYLNQAREATSPKQLFDLWEKVNKLYERRYIGQYEFEELKSAICPKLHDLCSLRAQLNEVLQSVQAKLFAPTLPQATSCDDWQ